LAGSDETTLAGDNLMSFYIDLPFCLQLLQQNGRQHLQLTPAKFCRN